MGPKKSWKSGAMGDNEARQIVKAYLAEVEEKKKCERERMRVFLKKIAKINPDVYGRFYGGMHSTLFVILRVL